MAVGFGSSETIAKLARFQDENDIPWTMAAGPARMARDYDVRVQSTKLGIAADGLVVTEADYSTASADAWTDRLKRLADR